MKPAEILEAMNRGPDLRDLYGTCDASPCGCLKLGWRGRLCANWTPLGVVDQVGLARWHDAAWTQIAPPATTSETRRGESTCT